MCVCASINPGMAVYRVRSITSTPGGMDEPSALTLRMRSFSITTTAFVIAFPAPSMSLPKRSALIGAADLDAGQTPNRTAKDERMIIEILTLRIGCIPLVNERFPSMSQYMVSFRWAVWIFFQKHVKTARYCWLIPSPAISMASNQDIQVGLLLSLR